MSITYQRLPINIASPELHSKPPTNVSGTSSKATRFGETAMDVFYMAWGWWGYGRASEGRDSSVGIAPWAGRPEDRIPVGGEIFRTRPDQPWGPPSPYTIGTGYFPGVKRARVALTTHPPSSAEAKERVGLYLYSPSGPSWPVSG